jgi:twitching motility protein PilT
MALFGKQVPALQRIVSNSFRSPEERDELLRELRTAGLRPADVIPLIWHTDAVIRQAGVDIFIARPDQAALITLIERMGEQPAQVRSSLTRLFGRIPAETMTRTVEDFITSRLPQKKRLGWEVALMLAAPMRTRYLERAVVEAPATLRPVALHQLMQDRAPSTIVPLLMSLAKDDDPRVATPALEALGRVDAPQIVELMLGRLAQGDTTSRERASAYLREAARTRPLELRRRLLDQLGSGDDGTRYACVQILLLTGKPEEVLTDILVHSRNLLGWVRSRVLDTLKTFGEKVFEPALAILSHDDKDVRTSALVLAENFNDLRLLEPVLAMLNDRDWWLRITACDTLGRLRDPRAVPGLVRALQDEDTRWAALDALSQIGSPAAVENLLPLIDDKRPEVRLDAIRAAGKFNDRRTLPRIQKRMLHDPSPDVRVMAAQTLKSITDKLNVQPPPVEEDEDEETPTLDLEPEVGGVTIDALLRGAREQGASDLHLTINEPPMLRTNGELIRDYNYPELNANQTTALILPLLGDRERKTLEAKGEVDFCHSIQDVGRYRVNVFRQRLGLCGSFRVIPNQPPTFSELRLPPRLAELLELHQGLVVVSGPAGSGKSTTLAALVNLINESRACHVITLEDPIEFVHPIKSSLVNQREIGRHSSSFERALRAALREDPDVIVVGEMRDIETIRLALTAAETGHLVIATLHTSSAMQTIDRMVKSFPPDEQQQVRLALSESLKYVICQSLIPRRDGNGRVGVFEILKGVMSVSNLIRENKTHQLPSMMQLGQSVGMQTNDQALLELLNNGLIAPEQAWLRAERPENFEALCNPAILKEMRFIE